MLAASLCRLPGYVLPARRLALRPGEPDTWRSRARRSGARQEIQDASVPFYDRPPANQGATRALGEPAGVTSTTGV
ncbi:hypothetical protein AAFF_G00251210 [Aldrovandia affinis]|uniref:Uncharacterized protein n=1 Tax=Aldrovandia affinis TaxID=143900 RepID=A0AAD7RCM8_9TELE|nr:hypothetical protein AAFF_G00251210 [Aldrovandia affinis]